MSIHPALITGMDPHHFSFEYLGSDQTEANALRCLSRFPLVRHQQRQDHFLRSQLVSTCGESDPEAAAKIDGNNAPRCPLPPFVTPIAMEVLLPEEDDFCSSVSSSSVSPGSTAMNFVHCDFCKQTVMTITAGQARLMLPPLLIPKPMSRVREGF